MTVVTVLAGEFVDELFAVEPLTAALLGVRPDAPGLDDPSAEAEAAHRGRLSALLERARAVEAAGLSGEDRVTREVLVHSIEGRLDLIDSHFTEFTVSDLFVAPAAGLLSSLPMVSVAGGASAEAHLGRLAGIPAYLRAIAERHRAGIAAGRVPVARLVRGAIAHLDRYLAEPAGDPLLRQPAPDEEFATRREELLRDVVHPAFREYRDFLEAEVLQHGRPDDQAGVSWLPGGDEIYARLARLHTTTARGPQDLHDTGLAVIAGQAEQYRELGARVFGTRELPEIFDRLRNDPKLRWSSAGELLDTARSAITRAAAESPKWFGRIPGQPWTVEAVPEDSAPGAPPAYYMLPAADGSRPGTYFANTYEATERFRHTAEATAFHEAIPGHHFQLSTALGLTDLPLLRRIGDFTAYTEGWGLYTERLADEMGLYSDDVALLGMLTLESMRAGRLVVDTGLHALGWSRQQAIDYLVENTPMAPVEIEAEVDRYIGYPGQALAYMVGRLEIQRIRAAAEARLGSRFDVRAFHDVVLSGGAMPLSVLDGVVSEWVAGHGDTVNGLAEDLLELDFERQPLERTIYGLPGDHDKLGDPSLAGAQRYRAAYDAIATRAEAIGRAGLSSAEIVTRDVVITRARGVIDSLDSRLSGFAVSDGFSAPALYLLMILAELKPDDEEKARGHLSRLGAVGAYLDALIEAQRATMAEGLVPPDFLVKIGIGYVDRYLEADTDPLRVTPVAEIEGFAEERDRLLAEVVHPAFARYRAFLADEALPLAKPETEPGIGHLPGGQEKYQGLIRAETTTERTAQDLHDTGLRVAGELAAEYRELGARMFGTAELPEIFERLRSDPELRWRDGEELLDSARSAVTRAEAVAPQWFSRVPAARCVVVPVPEAEAASGTIAYYLPPSFDGSRPGTYYANTYEASSRPRFTSEAIAFHEAVPGHHFQLSFVQELTGLPMLRRVVPFTAYLEGWGLYAERLADEMGLYLDDLTRLGMLTQDSMRAGRLVVDTGLHALGWSRQQAIDYLIENTPMAKLEIEAEVDRYVANPGQALGYMVGRLEIQRVRAGAERALGADFDIREFHDVVLGNGILPLSTLDDLVTEWVSARAGR
ncbi:DUF885 domain-containing protein [Amycolatopsis saalfeldensis]|uniref:Uncharacterized conserved protein, DUF885 familyt n=1 Tax=Amycolatopsis saalfeldensis TaxID=394193 RepID=A0A1H8VSL7_9PSEU|nr:DUF885 domain-containing protein [Amycolatopsis saalfeldensis]SEP18391.1 Uncharacterized conserved protein, DUF885 familyt [Amycolatopsis saalfeldensis]